MYPITYSLKSDQANSESYYRDVRSFTDETMIEANKNLLPIVDDFIDYLEIYQLEEIRQTEEYILELLSFGILWRSYAHKALKVKLAPFITLARMAEWRKKHQRIKPYIDITRGVLISLFLVPKNGVNKTSQIPTLEQIDHVCKWFEATGEFREQALRFIRWRAFWGTKSLVEVRNIFYTIQQFTNWFEMRAREALEKYTENVELFLRDSDKRYIWREDRIQCNRTLLEYHLNMVGAELMNRAFRSDFKDTDAKAILVPGCMRGKSADKCEAQKVKEGLKCTGCFPQCRVNQLREMGKRQSFDVYIIPHASDLSLWSPGPGKPKLGVIASACVTTLVEGGWELKRYDVPAQCVLLDSCGCKKHWDISGKGISTAMNIRELKRIVGYNIS